MTDAIRTNISNVRKALQDLKENKQHPGTANKGYQEREDAFMGIITLGALNLVEQLLLDVNRIAVALERQAPKHTL